MNLKIDKDVFLAYKNLYKVYKNLNLPIQKKELEKIFKGNSFIEYVLALIYYDITTIYFSDILKIFKIILMQRYDSYEWFGSKIDWKKGIINLRNENKEFKLKMLNLKIDSCKDNILECQNKKIENEKDIIVYKQEINNILRSC